MWQTELLAATTFLPAAAILAGLWRGSRRRLVEALAEQVRVLHEQTRLREQAVRAQERTRIATEMHDVLAHRLSLLALHAGVLTAGGSDLPPAVVERLRLLRNTSVEALGDLRDVLGALRDPERTEGGVLAPAGPGLADLVDESRRAGQQVTLTTDGQASFASAAHQLAVTRIVQEAITNARKHAAGAAVTVRVTFRHPATMIEAENAAPAADFASEGVSAGYGLIGLQERVAALGGTFDAHPHPWAGGASWRRSHILPTSSPRRRADDPRPYR